MSHSDIETSPSTSLQSKIQWRLTSSFLNECWHIFLCIPQPSRYSSGCLDVKWVGLGSCFLLLLLKKGFGLGLCSTLDILFTLFGFRRPCCMAELVCNKMRTGLERRGWTSSLGKYYHVHNASHLATNVCCNFISSSCHVHNNEVLARLNPGMRV